MGSEMDSGGVVLLALVYVRCARCLGLYPRAMSFRRKSGAWCCYECGKLAE